MSMTHTVTTPYPYGTPPQHREKEKAWHSPNYTEENVLPADESSGRTARGAFLAGTAVLTSIAAGGAVALRALARPVPEIAQSMSAETLVVLLVAATPVAIAAALALFAAAVAAVMGALGAFADAAARLAPQGRASTPSWDLPPLEPAETKRQHRRTRRMTTS